ncbi:hypothetical protein ACQP3L_38645, partial [Escherichia coli]
HSSSFYYYLHIQAFLTGKPGSVGLEPMLPNGFICWLRARLWRSQGPNAVKEPTHWLLERMLTQGLKNQQRIG